MPHKTHLTPIAASIILILMKIKLQAFRVAGAFFRVVDEMRWLLAYFDNSGHVELMNSIRCRLHVKVEIICTIFDLCHKE